MNPSPSARGPARPPPVALVHGYQFDPEDPEHDPHELLFKLWLGQLEGRRCLPFGWYSAPGWKGMRRAWARLYLHSYAWAYRKLAPKAAEVLAGLMERDGRNHDVLCHSLGSRVALLAADRGAPIRNLVILNGAELVRVAEAVARARHDIRVTNIYAKTDAVIDGPAEWFTPGKQRFNAPAIGNDGLGGRLPNWTDVVLDDEATQVWASDTRGWLIAGDNPRRVSDHNFSYEWEGNWPLIRAALDGDPFEGIPVAR